MNDRLDRRRFLTGIGSTAAAVALAGCSGGGGGDGGGGNGDGGSGSDGDGGGGDGGSISEEARTRVEEYVTTEGFDGEITDATGQDSVTVEVGAEGNGGAFAFAPPAVAVSPGTTVTWEWTGEGGQHNVVSDSGSDFSFESELKTDGSFEQSFEEAGVALYVCEPHESLNMNGAVVVTG
jgi:halocyanin-like protein